MKRLRLPPYKTAKVDLFDFSPGMSGDINGKIARENSCDVSFNYSFFSGALTDGVGVKRFEYSFNGETIKPVLSQVTAKRCYYYKRFCEEDGRRDDRILLYCSDKNFYQVKLFERCLNFEKIDGLSFENPPSSVCYKFNGDDVIILSCQNEFKILNGESVTVVDGVPDITSMCMHNERLFVTTGGEQTSLWFSNDFNPTDWYVSLNNAGFIDFQDGRGRLLKVISFNNYVYVFRNYGISRISAFHDQSEFSVSNLFLASGRIYQNAIVDCGNLAVYLAEDGFYAFDGYSSSRILKKYDKYLKGIDNSGAVGKFYNGVIYISLKMKVDNREQKVLLCYNLSSGDSYIASGLKIEDIEILCGDDYSKMLVLPMNSNVLGEICDKSLCFSSSLKKLWKSHFTDFSIDKRKSLAKISLYTKNDIEITVESDNCKKTIKVCGSGQKQTVKVGVTGRSFRISISSQCVLDEVSKVTLYFNYF